MGPQREPTTRISLTTIFARLTCASPAYVLFSTIIPRGLTHSNAHANPDGAPVACNNNGIKQHRQPPQRHFNLNNDIERFLAQRRAWIADLAIAMTARTILAFHRQFCNFAPIESEEQKHAKTTNRSLQERKFPLIAKDAAAFHAVQLPYNATISGLRSHNSPNVSTVRLQGIRARDHATSWPRLNRAELNEDACNVERACAHRPAPMTRTSSDFEI